ncbi:MAG: hypothetical protein AAFZ09_10820 [Pseudomonadota bacterium]
MLSKLGIAAVAAAVTMAGSASALTFNDFGGDFLGDPGGVENITPDVPGATPVTSFLVGDSVSGSMSATATEGSVSVTLQGPSTPGTIVNFDGTSSAVFNSAGVTSRVEIDLSRTGAGPDFTVLDGPGASSVNLSLTLLANESIVVTAFLTSDVDFNPLFDNLVLEYTTLARIPVPAALPLLLGGVALLAYTGRRRETV